MGSVTYEWVLGAWTRLALRRQADLGAELAELERPEGEDVDVRIADAQPPDLIDEMRSAAGERDIWVVGGGNVASQFADHGLLDRVEVTIVPVVLGEGKPLLEPGSPVARCSCSALGPSPAGWSA